MAGMKPSAGPGGTPRATTLDDLLREQAAGTYSLDRDLKNAKGALTASAPLAYSNERGTAEDAALNAGAEQAAKNRLTPWGTTKAYAEPALDALKVAAIPASFLGGPVGMVAGAELARQGVTSAIEDPSLMNLAFAAMGARPYVSKLKGVFGGAGKAASAVGEVLRDGEASADVMSRVKGGGGTGVPYRPKPQPYTMPENPNPPGWGSPSGVSPDWLETPGEAAQAAQARTTNAAEALGGLSTPSPAPAPAGGRGWWWSRREPGAAGIPTGPATNLGPNRVRQSTEIPYRNMTPKIYDPQAEVDGIRAMDARRTIREGAHALEQQAPEAAATPEATLAGLSDWRSTLPSPELVKQAHMKHPNMTQVDLANEVIKEGYPGWGKVKITKLKGPVYPAGGAPGGKRKAIRQREWIAGQQS